MSKLNTCCICHIAEVNEVGICPDCERTLMQEDAGDRAIAEAYERDRQEEAEGRLEADWDSL